jgi:hypothetical protein
VRYRRRRLAKLTDEQKALERYADRAGVRLGVITAGLHEAFKYCDSSKDLEILQSIIDNDLDPAIKLAERTQADLEASFSKRSKTAPGRTAKTTRKDKTGLRPKK